MMDGILNILKPTGMTSHDVVSSVRKILGIKKVGHAGTLDPNVAGVLVICVGKGTKFSEILMNGDKEYICELILGKSTDTQDSYGNITDQRVVPNYNEDDIKKVLNKFAGEQLQIPPAFSAVKYKGKKLYEYARSNIIIEKPGRKINITNIELLKFNGNRILMKVKCSKGTYMRTLCNDIGNSFGTLGHMGILIRTDSKGFSINESITLEELKYVTTQKRLKEYLIPIDKIIPLKKIYVDDKYYDKLINGNEININLNINTDENFYIYCKDILIGIGHKTFDNKIKVNKLMITLGGNNE